MNFLNTPEFKVGAMVIAVSGIIGMMSLRVAEGPGVFGGANTYWFQLEDASGLVKNSGVRVAGINVGVIEDIRLERGQARVYMAIDGAVKITESAAIEIKADGILGDKHVSIFPGNVGDRFVESGGQISSIKKSGSLDNLLSEVSKITDSLSELASNLNKATQGEGDSSTPLGRIVLNIEKVTTDLSHMTGHNRDKIDDIIGRVQSITKTVDDFVGGDGENDFGASWQKAISSLQRIDKSLKNVEEITQKINDGEGTIGRLVNDEETVDGINEAIYNVNDFLGGASDMETSVDFHTEYLGEPSEFKSYLSLKVQPGLDRYYELGVVDDPRGVVKEKSTSQVLNGGNPDVTDKTTTFKNKVKFTALFAKNFWDFTFKGGIIENSGGVGFDYYLLNRDLRFSIEAFEFDDLHLRAFARYNLMKGIYLIGGGDDLSDKDLRSGFLGAGIFITNDDLKLLATKASF